MNYFQKPHRVEIHCCWASSCSLYLLLLKRSMNSDFLSSKINDLKFLKFF